MWHHESEGHSFTGLKINEKLKYIVLILINLFWYTFKINKTWIQGIKTLPEKCVLFRIVPRKQQITEWPGITERAVQGKYQPANAWHYAHGNLVQNI